MSATTSRSITMHGASSRRSRRKARIRSVISAPIDLARPRAREIAWWTHSSKNSRNTSQNSWTTIACGSRLPCPRGGDAGFGRASKPRRSVGDLKSTTIRLVRRNDYRCESESGSRTLRVAYVTDEEPSSARPARRTSLFGNPTFGGPAGDQKSPLRRCFKPRPLVENECKPVASDRRSGCGVWIGRGLNPRDFRPRRLSGLLSGCPPTGTQPQARAN